MRCDETGQTTLLIVGFAVFLLMAIAAWGTVITGTYVVYPWYRAKPPEGANLIDFPRYYLLDNPKLAEWHNFGMEWKENVAWFAPILATVVAFVVLRYGKRLAEMPFLRKTLIVTFVLAFGAAAVAGLMGALITKVDIDGQKVEDVVAEWLKNNEARWKGWVGK